MDDMKINEVENTEVTETEVVEITPADAPIVETEELSPPTTEDPDDGLYPIEGEAGEPVDNDGLVIYGDSIPLGIE